MTELHITWPVLSLSNWEGRFKRHYITSLTLEAYLEYTAFPWSLKELATSALIHL